MTSTNQIEVETKFRLTYPELEALESKISKQKITPKTKQFRDQYYDVKHPFILMHKNWWLRKRTRISDVQSENKSSWELKCLVDARDGVPAYQELTDSFEIIQRLKTVPELGFRERKSNETKTTDEVEVCDAFENLILWCDISTTRTSFIIENNSVFGDQNQNQKIQNPVSIDIDNVVVEPEFQIDEMFSVCEAEAMASSDENKNIQDQNIREARESVKQVLQNLEIRNVDERVGNVMKYFF